MKTIFKYIAFEPGVCEDNGNIKGWHILNRKSRAKLGFIAWYWKWKQYVFLPGEAMFSSDCLRDIATFIDDASEDHRKGMTP